MAKEAFQGSAFTKRRAESFRKRLKAQSKRGGWAENVTVRKTKKAGKVRYDLYTYLPKKKR